MKNLFLLLLASCLVMASCSKDEDDTTTGTCTDGIKNQTETAIDCGGPCAACATCADGILNQGETAIDCGGPCTACPTNTCQTCTSPAQGGNSITYCEDDFATRADYDAAINSAVINGWTCQ